MADIKIGDLAINNFKVDLNDVDKIYLGDDLLYPQGQPPTPPSFKYKLTLRDGSTVSAECDATSAITSAEISAYTSTIISAEIGCVSEIGERTFYGCRSLTSITIPNSVTTLGGLAFYYCRSLQSIDIPNSVTSIGREAFNGCTSLQSITIHAVNPPTIGEYVFEGLTCPIYVPSGSVNAYKAAWSNYASRIQAIP